MKYKRISRTFLFFFISVYQQSPFLNSDRKVNLKGMKMSMRYQDCMLIAHTLNVLTGARGTQRVYGESHNGTTTAHLNNPINHLHLLLLKSINKVYLLLSTHIFFFSFSLFYSSIYFTALKFNLEANLPALLVSMILI